jgi:hypothetical protein
MKQAKITKEKIQYPSGEKPDFVIPQSYGDFRFALGKSGNNMIAAICMNPSSAGEEHSDRTANRIISIGKELHSDGWIIFNTYPERATNAKDICAYQKELSDKNITIIKDFLKENKINEVFGAWGDLYYNPLMKGKNHVIEMLKKIGVKIFYFGTLTKQGNPRHPLQRYEKWIISEENKKYLEIQ